MKNVNLVRLSFQATALLSSVALAENRMTTRAEATDPWIGSLSWTARTSTSNVFSDVPGGGNNFKWKFKYQDKMKGNGYVESVAFPGYCLKANGGSAGSAVILATCDFNANDKAQIWIATRERLHDSRGWYSFRNFAYFSTSMCMQGMNLPTPISLQTCGVPPGPNQVWSVFNEILGSFVADLAPFLQ